MNINRRVFLFGGTAITAITLGQLGKSQPSLAQSRRMNLYSSRHYDTDQSLYDTFQSDSGARVNMIEAGAGELMERIKSEGRNSPADVLLTVDAGNLWRAQQDGLFQAVDSDFLNEKIPASRRDPDGFWYGFSERARVIFYNKANVDPSELSTYEALADRKWRGKILLRSSTNIYNKSLVASRIAIHGEDTAEDWVKGIFANFARPPEGNDTAQIKACAAGIGDIAIANSYYFARLARSSDPADRDVIDKVGIFFPNQGAGERGTHVNISGGGVLKNSPNRAAAIAFLEHLAKPVSQRLFSDGNNEYPVVKDVEWSDTLMSFGRFNIDNLNVAEYGKNQLEAVQMMDRAGWT
ncbi:MAG: Fe(3+) ABC transporter substrate-binding protein [Cyanobacteria bacterium P01_E01_bin.42]